MLLVLLQSSRAGCGQVGQGSWTQVGLGWAGLGWAGLGWAGLGRAGLGWVGLGWAGLARSWLGWDRLSGVARAGTGRVGLGWSSLGRTGPGWAGPGWVRLGYNRNRRWCYICPVSRIPSCGAYCLMVRCPTIVPVKRSFMVKRSQPEYTGSVVTTSIKGSFIIKRPQIFIYPQSVRGLSGTTLPSQLQHKKSTQICLHYGSRQIAVPRN